MFSLKLVIDFCDKTEQNRSLYIMLSNIKYFMDALFAIVNTNTELGKATQVALPVVAVSF